MERADPWHNISVITHFEYGEPRQVNVMLYSRDTDQGFGTCPVLFKGTL